MPILKAEPSIYPADLLDANFDDEQPVDAEQNEQLRRWYAVYTISRREKDLIRKLRNSTVSVLPASFKTS